MISNAQLCMVMLLLQWHRSWRVRMIIPDFRIPDSPRVAVGRVAPIERASGGGRHRRPVPARRNQGSGGRGSDLRPSPGLDSDLQDDSGRGHALRWIRTKAGSPTTSRLPRSRRARVRWRSLGTRRVASLPEPPVLSVGRSARLSGEPVRSQEDTARTGCTQIKPVNDFIFLELPISVHDDTEQWTYFTAVETTRPRWAGVRLRDATGVYDAEVSPERRPLEAGASRGHFRRGASPTCEFFYLRDRLRVVSRATAKSMWERIEDLRDDGACGGFGPRCAGDPGAGESALFGGQSRDGLPQSPVLRAIGGPSRLQC